MSPDIRTGNAVHSAVPQLDASLPPCPVKAQPAADDHRSVKIAGFLMQRFTFHPAAATYEYNSDMKTDLINVIATLVVYDYGWDRKPYEQFIRKANELLPKGEPALYLEQYVKQGDRLTAAQFDAIIKAVLTIIDSPENMIGGRRRFELARLTED